MNGIPIIPFDGPEIIKPYRVTINAAGRAVVWTRFAESLLAARRDAQAALDREPAYADLRAAGIAPVIVEVTEV